MTWSRASGRRGVVRPSPLGAGGAGLAACLFLLSNTLPLARAAEVPQQPGAAHSESSLDLSFQGHLDSLVVTDPLSRRCSLGHKGIPDCDVWFDVAPSDISDTSGIGPPQFIMGSLPDPLNGTYRIDLLAHDSTTVFFEAVGCFRSSTWRYPCAARTVFANLAPGERVAASVKYWRSADSCSIEISGR
jgi:hypothetical protein